MTGPMIFTPEYYARMRALERDGWWNAAMRDVAARLLRLSGIAPTGTMLDVGCGSGQTMTWFRSLHPGWKTAGVDVSAEAVAAAHTAESAVSCASGLALPFGDRSMDLVIALDVLQHLPLQGGDLATLTEIRRVLRPGGLLLLRTNAQATPQVADDVAYNFHKYEPAELNAKLVASGFEVLRLSRINALLGLAEIPREIRAARTRRSTSYGGILAEARPEAVWMQRLKRWWLNLEGRAVAAGARLPMGRSIIAVGRTRADGSQVPLRQTGDRSALPPASNTEWKFWGATDPLFAVLAKNGREKHGRNPWTPEELRDAGARYFTHLRQQWASYGMGSRHCVEIGCGAGRVTAQLVGDFRHVTAVDVSAYQLEIARDLLGADLERLSLALVEGPTLPVPNEACDGVFTCEVFQHFDSDEPALEYLREAYRVLERGGTLCFQVPVRGVHRPSMLASPLRNSLLRLLRGLGRRRMMIYRQYDAPMLLQFLRSLGFSKVEMRVSYSPEHGGFEALFFATKP